MKGLDEMIEEFKNSEESKALDKVNEATKKLLSRKEVMNAMAEAVAETIEACFEEKNKEIATIRTGFETYKLIEKLFREEPAEEPDAEKPAEKTELSALEKLLFERTRLAVIQHDNGGRSAVQYARFSGLYDLIRDAGLETRYFAWKEEHGYE